MYTNNHFNEYNPEGCRGKLMPSSRPADDVDNFDELQESQSLLIFNSIGGLLYFVFVRPFKLTQECVQFV